MFNCFLRRLVFVLLLYFTIVQSKKHLEIIREFPSVFSQLRDDVDFSENTITGADDDDESTSTEVEESSEIVDWQQYADLEYVEPQEELQFITEDDDLEPLDEEIIDLEEKSAELNLDDGWVVPDIPGLQGEVGLAKSGEPGFPAHKPRFLHEPEKNRHLHLTDFGKIREIEEGFEEEWEKIQSSESTETSSSSISSTSSASGKKKERPRGSGVTWSQIGAHLSAEADKAAEDDEEEKETEGDDSSMSFVWTESDEAFLEEEHTEVAGSITDFEIAAPEDKLEIIADPNDLEDLNEEIVDLAEPDNKAPAPPPPSIPPTPPVQMSTSSKGEKGIDENDDDENDEKNLEPLNERLFDLFVKEAPKVTLAPYIPEGFNLNSNDEESKMQKKNPTNWSDLFPDQNDKNEMNASKATEPTDNDKMDTNKGPTNWSDLFPDNIKGKVEDEPNKEIDVNATENNTEPVEDKEPEYSVSEEYVVLTPLEEDPADPESIATSESASISTSDSASVSTLESASISTSDSASVSISESASISTSHPSSISTTKPASDLASESASGTASISTSDPTSIPTSDAASIPTSDPTSISTPDTSSIPTSDPTSISTSDTASIPTSDPTSISTPDTASIPTSDPTSISTPDTASIPTSDEASIPTSDPTSISTSDLASDSASDPAPISASHQTSISASDSEKIGTDMSTDSDSIKHESTDSKLSTGQEEISESEPSKSQSLEPQHVIRPSQESPEVVKSAVESESDASDDSMAAIGLVALKPKMTVGSSKTSRIADSFPAEPPDAVENKPSVEMPGPEKWIDKLMNVDADYDEAGDFRDKNVKKGDKLVAHNLAEEKDKNVIDESSTISISMSDEDESYLDENYVNAGITVHAEPESSASEDDSFDLDQNYYGTGVGDIPLQLGEDELDADKHCCYWASQGDCNSNPFWMRVHCQHSCGTQGCTERDALTCRVLVAEKCILPGSDASIRGPTHQPTAAVQSFQSVRQAGVNPRPASISFSNNNSTALNRFNRISMEPFPGRPASNNGACKDSMQFCPTWSSQGFCSQSYIKTTCCKSCKNQPTNQQNPSPFQTNWGP